MYEQALFRNRKEGRPATIDEYRESGGYQALTDLVRGKHSRQDVIAMLKDSELSGRGGAGFPTYRKWSLMEKEPHPRYVVPNTDEMEPGTFKDRMLVQVDPHLIIEGIILAGYTVEAKKAFFFIRPSYEREAKIMERELGVAREAGYLGKNILGTDFSFDIVPHRSAGRYICGEASAMVQAIMGKKAYPLKTVHMTEHGLWDYPTLINNTETLACVPLIIRHGGEWFKNLARTKTGHGNKIFSVSGKVNHPGCYELPMGIPFSEILENVAGGMSPGSAFKAFIPGGASTSFLPRKFYNIPMDMASFREAGEKFGTGAIMVFDHNTCIVAAALNLTQYFARESCGFCTPCREGLPYIRELLGRIEQGEGKEEYVTIIREMASRMRHAYCGFAPGAAEPILGMLKYFSDELQEHISQKRCPFGERRRTKRDLWYPPEEPILNG